MQGNQRVWRSVVAITLAVVGLLVVATIPVAQAAPRPKVLPLPSLAIFGIEDGGDGLFFIDGKGFGDDLDVVLHTNEGSFPLEPEWTSPERIAVVLPDGFAFEDGQFTLEVFDHPSGLSSMAQVVLEAGRISVAMNTFDEFNELSSVATPSIPSFTGTAWPYPDSSFSGSNPTWKNYLQVGYDGYTTIYIYANGSGLDQISSVKINVSGYSVSISSKTASKLTLKIQGVKTSGGYFDETSPSPTANANLTFYYAGGNLSGSITPGIIPAFNANLQAWGQCTWYAGYIARLRAGKTVVPSYSSTVPLNGDPSNPGFPTVNSVLNRHYRG